MIIQESKITLHADDNHKFDCYQFTEDKDAKVGLILLHEIFGMTTFIKNMCRLWAKKGCRVIAPALYDRLESNIVIPYTEDGYKQALDYKQKLLNWELQVADIESAKKHLRQHGVSQVVVLGYSWGGTLAWLSACRLSGIDCAISYYGTHIYQFRNEIPKAPCLLHFAEQDDLVPMRDVNEIIDLHPSIKVFIYQATHGFRCEDWQGGHGQQYSEQISNLADTNTEKFLLKIA